MAVESFARSADRVISRLAERQHGVVSHNRLVAAGVTRHQIAFRLRSGYLVELHRGVYLVGAVPAPHAHEMAALLACGPNGVLSHQSAAALWSLFPYPATAPVHVTISSARCVRRPRLRAHRTPIAGRDIRRREGMRVSSPPRVILELAADLDLETLELVVAEANYRRLAREAELRGQCARNPGKPGVGQLRRVIDLPGGPQRTRSNGEQRLLRGLRAAGIEGYEVNGRIHGFEVDFLWRDLGFAVELDGWDGHAGRIAFERDRLKISILKSNGVDIMPVTGRQLRDDLTGVLDRLSRALAIQRRKG
jgi:very-short-patch-repair endonuclease